MAKKVSLSAFDARGCLLLEVPPERYRLTGKSGIKPKPGDIVGLDQGFTGVDGLPMTLVYGFDEAGEQAYEAELYDSDFELVARQ